MFDKETMPRVKRISKGTDIILYGPGTHGQQKINEDAAEKFMTSFPNTSLPARTTSRDGPMTATRSTAASAAARR
jgi:hypothetical protein